MRLSTSYLAFLLAAVAPQSGVEAKTGPTSVAYVEVNSDSITNVGRYTLLDGSNAFDVAIIFAANINWNGSAAVLYKNPQVQALLDNATSQIKPLQAKGIKVVLSILGNHQGAGFANFATKAAATDFAGQVKNSITQYGLDGVDLDDEYADYGTNGTAQPNYKSVGWLIGALRTALPTKLITMYNIGPSGSSISLDPVSEGKKLSFAWNPYYGSFEVPRIPGLTKQSLSPAAVDFSSTSASQAASLAKRTVSSEYGAFMTYDLTGGNHSAYVSKFTRALYGQATTYK